eukprot:gnl/TRDRNA2_/TRDRNA2_205941_c0_seq1.p1 gnl/TRDRNA2_/TRDRNA2_205941_c0~~gnl/TRDRNA2_/TRDRNA2_205941_c0_seq1.p1  ORF type:complete len:346 (-),score=41.01 gnl/TRDRNA2_/TRDRNA2_205941_c0_seq1:40-1041(-)
MLRAILPHRLVWSAARRVTGRCNASAAAIDYSALRRQFDESGFCVVPSVLSSSILASIEAFSNAKTESMTPEQREKHKFTGSLIPTVDPVFQPLLTNAPTLSALDALGFGSDIKWSSGFIISKPPGGPSLAWHQDCAVWDHEVAYSPDPHQIFAMYYLTDTTVENGCLRVLPGTHRKRHPMHDVLAGVAAHSDDVRKKDVNNLGPEHADDVPDAVDVCVSAGDVVIGDNRLLHSARKNNSTERRTVITVWYHPHYGKQPQRVTHEFIPPVHATFCSPIYRSWSEEQLHEAGEDGVGILPNLHGRALLSEEEMDEDDHSLEGFDRLPRLERLAA